jgi:hypothetical protein
MSIDEPELRSRLARMAALAGPPRFATDDLAGRVRRIRRRRHWRAGISTAVSVAAVASAVAIPLTLGGTSPGVMSVPAPPGPRLSHTVTVNGQTRAVPARTGALPLFTVTPGERLTMAVKVTVPGSHALTALWLGITGGAETAATAPANMKPILAGGSRAQLRPGAHRFVLHWTVPDGLKPGASRYLSVDWASSRPEPGVSESDVAELAVPVAAATSPAAAARRLRALALHAVRNCDAARPAWIRAVRTTFSKAMAIPEVAQGDNLADGATDPVYLVLMKGYFIFNDGGRVEPGVCGHGPSGHYFEAVIDAATLVSLEAGLGNRPLGVPLRSLGRALSLGRSSRR